jgi:hypothetical protein
MFDNVRVRSAPETQVLGVAGQVGQVYGETTPSVTGVSVIGGSGRDYAINVHFKERTDTLWFDPKLLEFVDHAPGTTITIGQKTRLRAESGEWMETAWAKTKKAWWRFFM